MRRGKKAISPLIGLHEPPLPFEYEYVLSRNSWASLMVHMILGPVFAPMWLDEVDQLSYTEDELFAAVDWSVFKYQLLTVLALPGDDEHQFALRMAAAADAAGATHIFVRPLPKGLRAAYFRLDAAADEFRKAFRKGLHSYECYDISGNASLMPMYESE